MCMSAVPIPFEALSNLYTAEYIIVITGRELRGHLMRQNIYRATEYDILPLNPDVSVQTPPNAVEAHLLALVRSHLQGGTFYFSYAWDITRRLQAQWTTLQQDTDKVLWEIVSPILCRRPSASSQVRCAQADDRFFWNKYALSSTSHTLFLTTSGPGSCMADSLTSRRRIRTKM